MSFNVRRGVWCGLLLFYVFVITAHFFAPQHYDATRYTLCELAAQNVDAPSKILLILGFCTFSLVMLVVTSIAFENGTIPLWLVLGSYVVFVFFYSMALVTTDYEVYTTMGLYHSQVQSDTHLILALIASSLFMVIILAHAWHSKSKRMHCLFIVLVFGFIILLVFSPRYYFGLYQRIIMILGTVWLALGFGVFE